MAFTRGEAWQQNLLVCLFGSFTTVFAMTLLLPFLPLYVEEMGVRGHAAVVQWSGICYGATFLTAAFAAPIWGRLGDRFGRKPNLVRAAFCMAIAMSLTGFTHTIWEFFGLRLLTGFAGGYATGSTILVAVQTPKARSAWALGVLSSGVMAGSIAGPLAGGVLPPLVGIRNAFLLAGALIFVAFIATLTLLRESSRDQREEAAASRAAAGPFRMSGSVFAMLVTGMLLVFANMSIEPIITVYVRSLISNAHQVTIYAGLTMAAAALGSIVSAAQFGKLADRVGHVRVILAGIALAAALLIPQAFVTTGWELIGLRFLMGVALGGLMPSVATVIRHSVPDNVAGTVLGYSVSAQYIGQVAGPVVGGFIGGAVGLRAVFLGTSALLALSGLFVWRAVGVKRAPAP
jgi:MFS family permease